MRIIRGQSGRGSEGKIFAMALSPDWRWLAVAGWMQDARASSGHVVRLYDFATGRLAGLLRGHANIVNGLAFSRDGKLLMSGGGLRTTRRSSGMSRGARMVHHLKGHTTQHLRGRLHCLTARAQ